MRGTSFFIGLLLLFLPFLGDAQQVNNNSLLGQNLFDLNPAAAGMYGRNAIALRHRAQWTNFEGAPSWSYLSFHSPINDRLAFGIRLHQEEIAAFKSIAASGGFSWRTALGRGQLSFALEAGIQRLEINQNALLARDENDAWLFLDNELQHLFNMQFGALYRSKKSFVGCSVQQLLPSVWDYTENASGTQVMHVHLHAGTKIPLNARFELRPNFNLRYLSNRLLHPEAQVGLNFDERFTLGGGYRWSGDAYALAEIQVKKTYRLAYLYEMNTQELASISNGSHEIFVAIVFGKLRSSKQKSFLP